MKRATMSFDEKREALLKAATSENAGKCVTKTVSFVDDDVPAFLNELRRFREESRKKEILAR